METLELADFSGYSGPDFGICVVREGWAFIASPIGFDPTRHAGLVFSLYRYVTSCVPSVSSIAFYPNYFRSLVEDGLIVPYSFSELEP